MIYNDLIERVMQHYTSGKYADEVSVAKKEFYRYAGVFDEESPFFEMKMSQFMDWYVFTRKMDQSQKPPIAMVFEDKEYKINSDESEAYNVLAESHHSIFEWLKLRDNDVFIKDLYHNEKINIKESPVSVGFNKGEVFEARLVKVNEEFLFMNSFCFHPPQATKYILKEIKLITKNKDKGYDHDQAMEDLIHRLFKMKYKHEQYQHVGVKEIYSNDSKVKVE